MTFGPVPIPFPVRSEMGPGLWITVPTFCNLSTEKCDSGVAFMGFLL